jgi:hypothetical protein
MSEGCRTLVANYEPRKDGTLNLELRTSNLEKPGKATFWQKHKVESRKQKSGPQTAEATQSHINATSKPPQSVLIAN